MLHSINKHNISILLGQPLDHFQLFLCVPQLPIKTIGVFHRYSIPTSHTQNHIHKIIVIAVANQIKMASQQLNRPCHLLFLCGIELIPRPTIIQQIINLGIPHPSISGILGIQMCHPFTCREIWIDHSLRLTNGMSYCISEHCCDKESASPAFYLISPSVQERFGCIRKETISVDMNNLPFISLQSIHLFVHSSNKSILYSIVSSPFCPVGNVIIVIFFFAQPPVDGRATSACYVVEEYDPAFGVGCV